ncbi:hypothetical protein [Pseudomonas phage PA1C]|uniref:Uncharacterized protein n=1 Tax=Pseudomonas phage vB_PaeM_PS119XW TaxID=2601632 RepID=A0A5C1K7X6_9CAUD|nr:hypothetical protein PP933_gp263 [Pseudomonas phage vB_PaeM_PS119XW]QBX32421.1 hypothetical protein [Pseudomonas phage PA1C]QEM41992.1 hypothetical protein [Pseudomonas phage vB_PaeM_PS119XW]
MSVNIHQFSHGLSFCTAVIQYHKLVTFIQQHTESNSLSIEKGSSLYTQFIEWFNNNCEWIPSTAKSDPELIRFMVSADVSGYDDPRSIVYETTSQLYGINGRGLLTEHAINSMVENVKEYFESNNSNVIFGDENTFIELITDGTPNGTKMYSIVFIDVNEATPKKE